MGANSLFIFLTHKTRLIRQFLPKHMAEGSQADLPEHMVRPNLAKREPTSNRSRNATCNSTTYMQEPCTERNNIAHESIERARKGAYGPRGAQTNHASHTDRKACSDQKRISCTCAAPPGSHHIYERLRRRTTSVGSHQAKGAMARVQRNVHTSAFEADARATNSVVYEITLRATRGCG